MLKNRFDLPFLDTWKPVQKLLRGCSFLEIFE